MERLSLSTSQRVCVVELTDRLQEVVWRSGVEQGLCVAYVPHTTAAITINEHADPAVMEDFLAVLNSLVPREGRYRHTEGNADAHIKSILVGSSVALPIEGGRLALGTWQGVFFCEFDGPRRREVWVQVLPGR